MHVSCGRDSNSGFMLVTPPPLDSLRTEYLLDNVISGWYADQYEPDVYRVSDLYHIYGLRYTPYFYQTFTDKYLPIHMASNQSLDFLWHSRGDSGLVILGTQCMERYNEKLDIPEPKLSIYDRVKFKKEKYHNYRLVGNETLSIDSLMARALAYNDRQALEKLEEYYLASDNPKGIAIHYKAMLNYEGNGDLAERFYNVLKPYLGEKPQYRNGIRQVLLRAAICDGNARAQELCDSLGYSLCDYRRPVPGNR